jgi:hypothetical protein
MRDKKTWTPATKKPGHTGMYQVQTKQTSCGCCWEEADYRDGRWWRYGKHVTLNVKQEVQVTHWRKPVNVEVSGRPHLDTIKDK